MNSAVLKYFNKIISNPLVRQYLFNMFGRFRKSFYITNNDWNVFRIYITDYKKKVALRCCNKKEIKKILTEKNVRGKTITLYISLCIYIHIYNVYTFTFINIKYLKHKVIQYFLFFFFAKGWYTLHLVFVYFTK